MTADEHAQAIREAVEALNATLLAAAKASVGAILSVEPAAESTPEVVRTVRATPFYRL